MKRVCVWVREKEGRSKRGEKWESNLLFQEKMDRTTKLKRNKRKIGHKEFQIGLRQILEKPYYTLLK